MAECLAASGLVMTTACDSPQGEAVIIPYKPDGTDREVPRKPSRWSTGLGS